MKIICKNCRGKIKSGYKTHIANMQAAGFKLDQLICPYCAQEALKIESKENDQ